LELFWLDEMKMSTPRHRITCYRLCRADGFAEIPVCFDAIYQPVTQLCCSLTKGQFVFSSGLFRPAARCD
jgi:hypothetical protein